MRYAGRHKIDVETAAALDDGVKGWVWPSIGIAEQQPVLLSKTGGPNGAFHEVVVALDAIFKINTEQQSVE